MGRTGREDGITERELEVVRLLATGSTLPEVAAALGIALKTADSHKTNLMEKLGLHRRAQLTLWAIEQGIIVCPCPPCTKRRAPKTTAAKPEAAPQRPAEAAT